MPECRWLDDGETLTYLHSTVSTNRHRVRVPETPMYLDALLADQPLTGGLEPRLGDASARPHDRRFPTATTPGILDDLNRLAFPYRWSTRAILLDKTDATKLLTKIRRQWFAKRKSIAAILKEVMTNEASVLVDTDASNKAADADIALQELGADYAGKPMSPPPSRSGTTIRAWRPRSCGWSRRSSRAATSPRCRRPSTPSMPGSGLPGHVYANVRQPPISTLNLAHMIPLSAVWAGPERDEHSVRPLALWQDRRLDPVPAFLHVGDVGHTLIVGPTGAGKSVLLALMALQFRRYRSRRSSPSTSAGRSAPPRSPCAATGTISAAA
jgi:type IV secretion system protein VirB4